jgi:hypothetical protein
MSNWNYRNDFEPEDDASEISSFSDMYEVFEEDVAVAIDSSTPPIDRNEQFDIVEADCIAQNVRNGTLITLQEYLDSYDLQAMDVDKQISMVKKATVDQPLTAKRGPYRVYKPEQVEELIRLVLFEGNLTATFLPSTRYI